MSKTIHGTKYLKGLRQSDWWFKHLWHKRYRARARVLSRLVELGEEVVANDYPHMREVSDTIESKSEHW